MYGNLAKKGWVLSDDDYAKYPDLRGFDVSITPEMRQQVLDKIAYVLDCVKNGTPPPLDLDKFNFNNYKTACSLSLTDDEYNALKEQVKGYLKSNLPDYVKNNYFEFFEFIKGVRENAH